MGIINPLSLSNLIKIFLVFLVLGLMIYWNSFSNKFLMDDYVFLSTPTVVNLKLLHLQWDPFMAGQTFGHYRPLAQIIPAYCYALFGNNFWQYHLFNLILFILAAFLLYICVFRISKNQKLAFLAAIFYIVHPINGIIVNYITASVFALQVILILSSIILTWEALGPAKSRILYYAGIVTFILALLCHESSVMTLFYLGIVFLLTGKVKSKNEFLYLVPFFLVFLVYLIFRMNFVSLNDIVFQHVFKYKMNFFEYVATLFSLLTWYIGKLFTLDGIVLIWVEPIMRHHVFMAFGGMVVLIGFFLFAFVQLRQHKMAQIGLLWFFIGFLPVLFAAFVRYNDGPTLEPHWFVFSVVGFFILVAHSFTLMLESKNKKWFSVLVLSIVVVWGSFSHAYNKLWSDEKTYARYWIAQVPHFKLPYSYLAHAYELEGEWQEAKRNYHLALTGSQRDAFIYALIGKIEMNQGLLENAQKSFQQSLRLKSDFSDAHYLLGLLSLQKGQLNEAEKYFFKALELSPYLIKSINFKPSHDVDALVKNALLYLENQQAPDQLVSFAILLAERKLFDIAWDCYRKALSIDPNYANAYFNAGVLLMKLGQINEAVHIWELGLKISPLDQRFKGLISMAKTLKSI